jgi:YegS/Rv2252/BmrU family lipid kinase
MQNPRRATDSREETRRIMKHCFLINPHAGRGSLSAEWEQKIRTACAARGIEPILHRTTAVGDAEDYVRKVCRDLAALTEQEQSIRFYACGGDGTLNEVVNGAADFPFAQVSVLPIGTGNDFVRNFAPGEAFFDLDALLDGTPIELDLLECNGRYTLNMINIGFDCAVVRQMEKLRGNALIPYRLAYVAALVITLIRKPGTHFRATLDGSEPVDYDLLLSTIANGRFCGGGFFSNPDASLTDERMDLCFVRNLPRIRFLTLVSKYKSGTHFGEKTRNLVYHLIGHTLTLEFDRPQDYCSDGEIYSAQQICIRISDRKIRFSLPRGVTHAFKTESEREPVTV